MSRVLKRKDLVLAMRAAGRSWEEIGSVFRKETPLNERIDLFIQEFCNDWDMTTETRNDLRDRVRQFISSEMLVKDRAIDENLQHHREYVDHILPVVRAAETHVDKAHDITSGADELKASFGILDEAVRKMRGTT